MIKRLIASLPTYGTVIPDLQINGAPAPYPVVNERAVRAGAGMLFVAGMFAFFHAWYINEYLYLKILVVLLLIDFAAKVVLGPRYSPVSRLAQFIVHKQTPEYVGAIQKRFAWSIGLFLATTMAILIFGFSILGPVNLLICSICLIFMFMESAFGICVGCKIYHALVSVGWISKPEHAPVCPGNVCTPVDDTTRHPS